MFRQSVLGIVLSALVLSGCAHRGCAYKPEASRSAPEVPAASGTAARLSQDAGVAPAPRSVEDETEQMPPGYPKPKCTSDADCEPGFMCEFDGDCIMFYDAVYP